MQVLKWLMRILPAAVFAGTTVLACLYCQKPQSAGSKIAVDSMAMANKAVVADTMMKKADTGAMAQGADSAVKEMAAGYYTCPMHPQIHSMMPGKCPICGMNLVFKKTALRAQKGKP